MYFPSNFQRVHVGKFHFFGQYMLYEVLSFIIIIMQMMYHIQFTYVILTMIMRRQIEYFGKYEKINIYIARFIIQFLLNGSN